MSAPFLLPQMSHLFNIAHNLRMLVQKERSIDILKVRKDLREGENLMGWRDSNTDQALCKLFFAGESNGFHVL